MELAATFDKLNTMSANRRATPYDQDIATLEVEYQAAKRRQADHDLQQCDDCRYRRQFFYYGDVLVHEQLFSNPVNGIRAQLDTLYRQADLIRKENYALYYQLDEKAKKSRNMLREMGALGRQGDALDAFLPQ
jgi:hypothetical protein